MSLLISILSLIVSLIFVVVIIHTELRLRKWRQQQDARRAAIFDAAMEANERLFADTPEEAELKRITARIYNAVIDAVNKEEPIKAIHLNPDYLTYYRDVQNKRNQRLGYAFVADKASMFCGFHVIENEAVDYGGYRLEIGCCDK